MYSLWPGPLSNWHIRYHCEAAIVVNIQLKFGTELRMVKAWKHSPHLIIRRDRDPENSERANELHCH